MAKKPKQNVPMWAKTGHGKPISRRELLASGVIPFSAWIIGPSLSTLLAPTRVFAADTTCAAAAGNGLIPIITINLAGGPSLASQVVVKDLSGNNLPSYSKLGQGNGPGISYTPTLEFGNVEFAGTAIGGNTQGLVSKFLTGMRGPRGGAVRNAALDKTAFIWSAVALSDDTSSNKLDITGMAIKMGLQGSKLPNLGRADTATGINQQPAMTPPPAPFVVGSVQDLTNAVGYAHQLDKLNINQKASLAKLISRLSGSQIRRIASTSGNTTLSQMVDCAGIRNVDLIASGGGDINPFGLGNAVSTEMMRIWSDNNNAFNIRSQSAVFGAMVYNGLTGNAASINLNLGGYDYHDATRTTGNQRDLEAGQLVGKILETASSLGKKVFIYVCADGATVSGESATADSAWMSDRGIAGMQYILAFDPAARPETSGFQIGGFNSGQGADGRFPTSTSAELAAQAVFANYAAWNGRMDFLEANRIANDADLRSKVIKLQKT